MTGKLRKYGFTPFAGLSLSLLGILALLFCSRNLGVITGDFFIASLVVPAIVLVRKKLDRKSVV